MFTPLHPLPIPSRHFRDPLSSLLILSDNLSHPSFLFSRHRNMLSITSARKTLNLVPTLLKAGYATAVSKTSNGVKIAALDESSPTASVSLVINAGSRFEPKDKAGIAHFVKNYGFKVCSGVSQANQYSIGAHFISSPSRVVGKRSKETKRRGHPARLVRIDRRVARKTIGNTCCGRQAPCNFTPTAREISTGRSVVA